MGFLEKMGAMFIGKEKTPEAVKPPVVPPEQKWKSLYEQRYALEIQADRETKVADAERLKQLDKQIADVESKMDPVALGRLKSEAATREEADRQRWAATGN